MTQIEKIEEEVLLWCSVVVFDTRMKKRGKCMLKMGSEEQASERVPEIFVCTLIYDISNL